MLNFDPPPFPLIYFIKLMFEVIKIFKINKCNYYFSKKMEKCAREKQKKLAD